MHVPTFHHALGLLLDVCEFFRAMSSSPLYFKQDHGTCLNLQDLGKISIPVTKGTRRGIARVLCAHVPPPCDASPVQNAEQIPCAEPTQARCTIH